MQYARRNSDCCWDGVLEAKALIVGYSCGTTADTHMGTGARNNWARPDLLKRVTDAVWSASRVFVIMSARCFSRGIGFAFLAFTLASFADWIVRVASKFNPICLEGSGF